MRKDRKATRVPTRFRIRKKISGDESRPRVAVYRSLQHIYLQAIDDANGTTLVHVSSKDADVSKKLKKRGSNVAAATEVGSKMAKSLKDKGVSTVLFDRGGFVFHGRIKAAAEAMRKAGIKF